MRYIHTCWHYGILYNGPLVQSSSWGGEMHGIIARPLPNFPESAGRIVSWSVMWYPVAYVHLYCLSWWPLYKISSYQGWPVPRLSSYQPVSPKTGKKWKFGEEDFIHLLNIIERCENDLHVCLIAHEESSPLLFTWALLCFTFWV